MQLNETRAVEEHIIDQFCLQKFVGNVPSNLFGMRMSNILKLFSYQKISSYSKNVFSAEQLCQKDSILTERSSQRVKMYLFSAC